MSAQPGSSYPSGFRQRNGRNKGCSYLNILDAALYKFGHFGRQLPFRDGLARDLMIRGRNLAIALIEIDVRGSATCRPYLQLSDLAPGKLGNSDESEIAVGALEKSDARLSYTKLWSRLPCN